jgi:hypothetical protein
MRFPLKSKLKINIIFKIKTELTFIFLVFSLFFSLNFIWDKMTESLKLEVNFNSVAQVIEETILKVNWVGEQLKNFLNWSQKF